MYTIWTYDMNHYGVHSNSILYASIPAWAILTPKSILVFIARASEASERLKNTYISLIFSKRPKIMTIKRTHAPYLDLSICHANIANIHHIQSLWFILLHMHIVSNLLLNYSDVLSIRFTLLTAMHAMNVCTFSHDSALLRIGTDPQTSVLGVRNSIRTSEASEIWKSLYFHILNQPSI